MFQNKGFTLIEVLLTLSIIIILSVLTFPYINTQSLAYDDDMIQYQIASIIDHAKSHALTNHQQVNVTFTHNTISYQATQKSMQYILPEGCYFSHLKKVYFNKNGNINQANHIFVHLKNKSLKLVFHLGNGDYYFES